MMSPSGLHVGAWSMAWSGVRNGNQLQEYGVCNCKNPHGTGASLSLVRSLVTVSGCLVRCEE